MNKGLEDYRSLIPTVRVSECPATIAAKPPSGVTSTNIFFIMLTDKQKATNYETLKHIEMVMQLLATMQHEIARRMFSHDRSKLESPEMEMFEQFTERLVGLTYGSEEYKQCLEEMKQSALGHHYAHNRHHPEHFPIYESSVADQNDKHLEALKQPTCLMQYPEDNYLINLLESKLEQESKEGRASINNMNLIDLLEALCDWKAASLRHNDGNIYRSLEINSVRFNLSPQLVNILRNTVPLLNRVYSARTQKHLNEYWHCLGCGSGGMEGNFCSMCGAGKNDYVAPQST